MTGGEIHRIESRSSYWRVQRMADAAFRTMPGVPSPSKRAGCSLATTAVLLHSVGEFTEFGLRSQVLFLRWKVSPTERSPSRVALWSRLGSLISRWPHAGVRRKGSLLLTRERRQGCLSRHLPVYHAPDR